MAPKIAPMIATMMVNNPVNIRQPIVFQPKCIITKFLNFNSNSIITNFLKFNHRQSRVRDSRATASACFIHMPHFVR